MIHKKIDIHAHVVLEHSYPYMGGGRAMPLTPEELRGMYDKIGVERGNALPCASPEHNCDQVTNREAYMATQLYPETIGWWFCNVDARWFNNNDETDFSTVLTYFKEHGAKGIGEFTCNMPILNPMMQNVFKWAEIFDMPVLFHMGKQGNDYGIVDDLGLWQLEETLKRFPKLRLIGHSHKWWSEISGDCSWENRGKNPKGLVAPGGRVVELMRKYPGMLGDLSAGSGENAIIRDPEFGYRFLEEFQDKLFFGVDYCTKDNFRVLSSFLDDAVEQHHISQRCYDKICRENALALLEG